MTRFCDEAFGFSGNAEINTAVSRFDPPLKLLERDAHDPGISIEHSNDLTTGGIIPNLELYGSDSRLVVSRHREIDAVWKQESESNRIETAGNLMTKNTFKENSPHSEIQVFAEARPNDLSWQDSHQSLVEKAAAGAPDIAFYGDSLTAAMHLNSDFSESLGRHADNFGINGDTTENLLYRLQNGEADFPRKKPDTAVILIGTNNIGQGFDSDEKIVAGILANTKEAGSKMPDTQLIVLGILPRGQSASDPVRKRVSAINNQVREQLVGVKNVKFVDISEQLLDAHGNLLDGVWQLDYLHLEYSAGYTAMFNALRPHLQ